MGESTPAAATAAPPAPADLLPRPSRRQVIGWYAIAQLVTIVVLAAGLRLDLVSLREPLEYDVDALLIMPMVKATIERGGHWRNERMGFPGTYELYDFPVVDHLHFAVIWVMGRFTADWTLVYNLYHLLTWPLTTLTAMWALRRLGLTLPFAAAGGILYAFQPYHYLRGEAHYFLAAYWMIPLSWLPALLLCKGEIPFFRRTPEGGYERAVKTRATAWQVALAAATASAGAYYAFFACAIYCVAGLYGWATLRTWRAAASGAALAGLVAAFGVVNHAPSVVHALKNSRAAVTERYAMESELYGMKLAQLVLPIDSHNLLPFRRARAAYTGSYLMMNNENAFDTLGAAGSVGLLGLLAVLVVPNRLGWPYRPAAALALFIVLFATVGGFGAIFNLLVFDQIRCLNRFSIYLAFLCLLALTWALDSWLAAEGRRRWRVPAAVGLVVVGLADQTPGPWFTRHVADQVEYQAGRFRDDRRFFAAVEQAAEGAKVFCLPYMAFPEVPTLHDLKAYEHARVYLHTNTLSSGYGAIKYRETDEWLKSVSFDRPASRLLRMVVGGFDGVLVDGRGYLTQADANRVVHEMRAASPVPLPEVIHDDRRQVFLDLRPYRDWLRAKDPAYFDREAAKERDFVALSWLRGFPSPEPPGLERKYRWAYRSAAFQIVNPSDRERTFDLTATFDTHHEGEFTVTLTGPPGLTWVNRPDGAGRLEDTFGVVASNGGPLVPGARRTYRLTIPPGRHTVRASSTAPSGFVLGDTRPIHYNLQDITFDEVR